MKQSDVNKAKKFIDSLESYTKAMKTNTVNQHIKETRQNKSLESQFPQIFTEAEKKIIFKKAPKRCIINQILSAKTQEDQIKLIREHVLKQI